MNIDISKLDKAAVLAALYNASKPQGMGFLQYDPKPMTRDEAAKLLESYNYFDYLKGRVMKVGIEDSLNPSGYDRDNGQGAAMAAIALVTKGDVNPIESQLRHASNTAEAANKVRRHLGQKTTSKVEDGIMVMTLGLADVAEPLTKALDNLEKKSLDA